MITKVGQRHENGHVSATLRPPASPCAPGLSSEPRSIAALHRPASFAHSPVPKKEDLLAVVVERGEREDADVLGQVLTMGSALHALGATDAEIAAAFRRPARAVVLADEAGPVAMVLSSRAAVYVVPIPREPHPPAVVWQARRMPDDTKILVLALHHSQSAAQALAAALPADLADRVAIVHKVFGELSSPYRAAAARHTHARSMVGALAEEAGLTDWSADLYPVTVAISWSAGYAWVDTALDHGAKIDGWVALDSGYGPVHTGVFQLAEDAAAGRRGLTFAWTDIETKPAYPSTGDYARGIEAHVAPRGLLQIEHLAHDPDALTEARKKAAASRDAQARGEHAPDLDAVGAFWRAEHRAALHRGPKLLIDMLRSLMARNGSLVAQRAPG